MTTYEAPKHNESKDVIAYCALHLEPTYNSKAATILCKQGLLYKMYFISESKDNENLDSLSDLGVLRKCIVAYDSKTNRYEFVNWIN